MFIDDRYIDGVGTDEDQADADQYFRDHISKLKSLTGKYTSFDLILYLSELYQGNFNRCFNSKTP